MKLVWLTDIHLNFIDQIKRIEFYQGIKNEGDALIISGDISEGSSVVDHLREMAHYICKPIYFVLGNHDYYHEQIDPLRESMRALTLESPYLFWLGCCDPITLDENTILMGADGWADGRYGDYANTPVSLNDSILINDLFEAKILGRYPLLNKMQQLADKDANNIFLKLQACAKNAKKIIVVTHVPPFKETAFHKGKLTDDNFLPFFASKATGDILMKFAKEHSSIELMVLCGHTHDACTYHALDNLTIFVGKSEYYQPVSQGVIENKTFKFLLKS